jgi:hypothetical protein
MQRMIDKGLNYKFFLIVWTVVFVVGVIFFTFQPNKSIVRVALNTRGIFHQVHDERPITLKVFNSLYESFPNMVEKQQLVFYTTRSQIQFILVNVTDSDVMIQSIYTAIQQSLLDYYDKRINNYDVTILAYESGLETLEEQLALLDKQSIDRVLTDSLLEKRDFIVSEIRINKNRRSNLIKNHIEKFQQGEFTLEIVNSDNQWTRYIYWALMYGVGLFAILIHIRLKWTKGKD